MPAQGGLIPSHVLRVSLDNIEPEVWRLIQVPVSVTLDELHIILQMAMGWENDHLYSFEVGRQTFSPPGEPFGLLPPAEPEPDITQEQLAESLKQLADIVEHPDRIPEGQLAVSALLAELGGSQSLLPPEDEDTGTVELGELLKRARSKMTYTYDFGDTWKHTIKVERANVPTDAKQPAICLDGANACPPEDSGGPWRYQDILEAIENPNAPDHEEEREWLDELYEGFDPTAFDRDAVNRSLARLRWSLAMT